jgi:ketosteroid isomerase-like protein
MRHGAFLLGLIAAAALAELSNAQPRQTEEPLIRTVITVFADARNAHDGDAASAQYSEDGEWISAHGYVVHGKAALATLWSGVTGQVERTIESIDLVGPNIAVVRVTTQYEEPVGRHHETFVLVKVNEKWNIRVHQSVD